MKSGRPCLLLALCFCSLFLVGCEKTDGEQENKVTVNHKEVLAGLDPESFDDDGTVVAFDGTTLKVTIPNFDADSIAPEDREYRYHTADEQTHFFTENTVIVCDEEGNQKTTIDYAEIGYEGFTAYLETGSAVCHFWLDESGYCTDIIIYGATTIWK